MKERGKIMFKEIIYNIILMILVPTIFALAGIGVRYGLAFLKLKLANTKLVVAISWIDKMVKAAEQKFNSEGMNETKKSFTGLFGSRNDLKCRLLKMGILTSKTFNQILKSYVIRMYKKSCDVKILEKYLLQE